MKEYVFLNGNYVEADKAMIPVRTHAFLYGTGVFEGIRAYYNEEDKQLYIFRMKEHYERMLRSGKIMFMNSPYTIEEYMERCNLIREYYDNPAITTDVIVGFPGETDQEFETTYNNLEKLNLYEMHIFKYSKRKGTVAADMVNQVSEEIKNERSDKLLEMAQRHKAEFEALFKGKKVTILAEECDKRKKQDGSECFYLKGHTERYIHLEKEYDEEFCKSHINEFVDVIL